MRRIEIRFAPYGQILPRLFPPHNVERSSEPMAKVIFCEKPGCADNARRRALPAASGYDLDVRNMARKAVR